MAFDEQGQADTYDRRIEICERAYRVLVDEVNFPPEDIIFDPNILAVATGIESTMHDTVWTSLRPPMDKDQLTACTRQRRCQ